MGAPVDSDTTVDVTGASHVRLWAEQLLNVVVAGSAEVRYAGKARIEQCVSGVANVLRVPQLAF
jgi:hypothetical protein